MKILVVDDHPLIQEALRRVLRDVSVDVSLLQASDADEAMSTLAQHPDTDLVLLDLALPGTSGRTLLPQLRKTFPEARVVVLSAFHDRATVTQSLDAGAMGFIPKTATPQILVGALKLILSGGVYLPAHILDDVDGLTTGATMPSASMSVYELGLTQRQTEVLELLVQGMPNKLICRRLNLSEGTVKVHVSAILRALAVHTRTQVVIELSRRGVRFPTASRATPLRATAQVAPAPR